MLNFFETIWFFLGFPCGISFILMMNSSKEEREVSYQFWATVLVSCIVVFAIWFILRLIGKNTNDFHAVLFLVFAIIGAFCAFKFLRKSPEIAEKISIDYTKKTISERNKKTDVREIEKHLPNAESAYNPEKHFKNNVFIGLGEEKNPVEIDKKIFKMMPHIQVVGTTGAGKGVIICVLCAQWIRSDEAVFYLDPKDDEWAPHLLASTAKKSNKAHFFINLRENLPQFSIFEGANSDEIEELFIAGFGLGETGNSSDFYSIDDRKYAGIIARQIAESGMTAAQAYAKNSELLEKNAPKFGGKLRELGEVVAANATAGSGVDFAEIVKNGGSCYIVGHMRMERIVRLQKMLLVRLMQIAEKRDRITTTLRPVAIVLDEVKYHLSKCALEALGAARDKGVHVVLAHQSLADLQDVGGDLSPDAVVGAVVENCKIKIAYRVMNPETAEWLARMSGTILVDDEVRTVEKNIALAEKVKSERSIRQADRYLFDENMMLNLPNSVAVVYGLGLAKFAHICNINVTKLPEYVKITEVNGTEIVKADELI